MIPKILLDEDIQLQLAFSLRRRGVDAIHIQEINRKGKTDEEQLYFALSDQRCLVSFNVKDFELLHEKFLKKGIEHYGIILSKQINLSQILNKLLNLIQKKAQNDLINTVEFL